MCLDQGSYLGHKLVFGMNGFLAERLPAAAGTDRHLRVEISCTRVVRLVITVLHVGDIIVSVVLLGRSLAHSRHGRNCGRDCHLGPSLHHIGGHQRHPDRLQQLLLLLLCWQNLDQEAGRMGREQHIGQVLVQLLLIAKPIRPCEKQQARCL